MNLNKVLIALALGFALTACTSKDEAANSAAEAAADAAEKAAEAAGTN